MGAGKAMHVMRIANYLEGTRRYNPPLQKRQGTLQEKRQHTHRPYKKRDATVGRLYKRIVVIEWARRSA
jgi:hypothetical protein